MMGQEGTGGAGWRHRARARAGRGSGCDHFGAVARSSQCVPAAAAVLGTEFAEDAVIDMVEIPERGFAGEPREHTADVTRDDTM